MVKTNKNPVDEITNSVGENQTPETESKEPPSNDNKGANIEDESVPKFNKEQLLKSNWYSHRRDILSALLEDDKMYSHAAVNSLIKEFLQKKVK